MPVITAIKVQRRSADRLNLYIDGEFHCGIATDVVVAERLRPGVVLDDSALQRLAAADECWKAKQSALSLLSARARATGELTDRLRRKGYSPEAVHHAISEMMRLGYLDDEAFAEAWVRDRLRLKPRGGRALAAELTRKRVSPDIVRDVISRVMAAEETDDIEICTTAAQKWLRTHAAPEPGDRDASAARDRRMIGYLSRRGFSHDTIRSAMSALLTH